MPAARAAPGALPTATATRLSTPAIRLASIDPGIDRVSVAFFAIEAGARPGMWGALSLLERAKRFERVHAIVTKAGEPLVKRLWLIDRELTRLLVAERPAKVLIELPAHGGVYENKAGSWRGRVGRSKHLDDLAKLHLATGTIISAALNVLGEGAVDAEPAQTMPKVERLALVEQMLRRARKECPTNADDRDAIGIGLGASWTV